MLKSWENTHSHEQRSLRIDTQSVNRQPGKKSIKPFDAVQMVVRNEAIKLSMEGEFGKYRKLKSTTWEKLKNGEMNTDGDNKNKKNNSNKNK